ncbi:MAG TPA: hypothetical protein PLN69_01200 [bacterium]|nr:hypothetical protein [bacterium]
MKNNLDKLLVRNIMVTVLGLTVVLEAVFVILRARIPGYFAENFFAGVVLGAVNLYFITHFVNFFTRRADRKLRSLALSFLAVCAIITGLFLLQKYGYGNMIAATAGFTEVLAVMVYQGIRILRPEG